jgi:hypothetical protein
MELTKEQIEKEIAKLEAEQQQFAQNASMQIAAYNGAIQVWQQLLAKVAAPTAETASGCDEPA